MGVELERMNAEHTMESREDCQELVWNARHLLDICFFLLISVPVLVLHGQRTDRQTAFDQKANAEHASTCQTSQG